MAITATGFTGTVSELQWAQFMELAMGGNAAQVINSGLDPATAGATRLISIAAGSGAAAGVKFDNSASVNVTLNANASSNNRLDIVVAQIDWSGDAVTFTKVTGTTGSVTPVLPALTQTAGVTWQIPLAVVTVRPSVTNIAAADVADVRPFRPSMKVYSPTVDVTTVGASASPKVIASRTVPDPGWPYRLRFSGGVDFAGVSAGRGIIAVNLDGAFITGGKAAQGNAAPAVLRSETTGILTGIHTVTMTMQALNMSVTLASQADAATGFTIEVIPS